MQRNAFCVFQAFVYEDKFDNLCRNHPGLFETVKDYIQMLHDERYYLHEERVIEELNTVAI